MIALKTLRRDLGAHLAAGLGGAHAPLGSQINPPAVVVVGSSQYVDALDYCTDLVTFDVHIIAKPGDLAAVADALDTMIDQIREQCATTSPAGRKYQFQGVGGQTVYSDDLPSVVATIACERQTDA